MSETANVRLVRCPKCENLLAEVTDYSVYQCGGCGAVLRAKNKGAIVGGLETVSEKSDEERIGGDVENICDIYDKMKNASEKGVMDMSDGCERRVLCDRTESNGSSLASKGKNRNVVQREDEVVAVEEVRIGEAFEDLGISHEYEDQLCGSEWGMGEGLCQTRSMDAGVMDRVKGGSLNLHSNSWSDNEGRARRTVDRFESFGSVDRDRADLLRKLDELKAQLSHSGDLMYKGKEKVVHDSRMDRSLQDPYALENWLPEATPEINQVRIQHSYGDTQCKRSGYSSQYVEQTPLMHSGEVVGNRLYPPHYAPNHVPPSRSHMCRRGPTQSAAPYHVLPSHGYGSRPYLGDNGLVYMGNMEPHPPSLSHHPPPCSCYNCQHDKRQVPIPIIPIVYNEKSYDVANERTFGYQNSRGSFFSRDYNHRRPDPPLRSHPARSQPRRPVDADAEVDGFIRRRPPRVHLASIGRHCRPVVGGAPFLTCYNCCELLMLPKIVIAKNDKQKRIRCGACSTLIAFAVSDKNLIISYNVEAKDNPIEFEDTLRLNNGGMRSNRSRTGFLSDDFDNSGYGFSSMDKELEQVLVSQGMDGSKELKNRHSTSTYTSEAEEDWGSLTAVRKDSCSADLSTKSKGPPLPLGSSLQDHFEHSNKYYVANHSAEGNARGCTEHEKPLANKATTRQISRSSATEIDLSSNEFNNTGATFNSGEASRERDPVKASGRAESFFAGIIKRSFKDLSRSNETSSEQEKANVTVNGCSIPDRVIKKAEKLAGSVQPGHYWYDFRAGFWGVIGGPCLGIIPPLIEEFNYPMSENCAGGNTRVFVNGRELHEKDLTLLASRGLPTESDRSYIVEISGRVLDEDTGEELDSLGKLAPTVEKLKRGFGMRAPKEGA